MFDVRDVARYLMSMSHSDDTIRMNSLLYYCQGWSLALLGKPLFHQEIEAQEKGPVIEGFYYELTHRNNQKQKAYVSPIGSKNIYADLINMVYRFYESYSTIELIQLTQSEPAWKEARLAVDGKRVSSQPLSHDTMCKYFKQQLHDAAIDINSGWPMTLPEDVWQAEMEIETHPEMALPIDEAFRQIRLTQSTASRIGNG